MELEDLVTGNLPEELQATSHTLLEISEEAYSPLAAFALISEAKKEWPHGNWQPLLSEVALRLMQKDRDRGRSGRELVVAILRTISGEDAEMDQLLERLSFEIEEDSIFHSQAATVEYAISVWGERAAEMIAASAGVRLPTAKKWIAGSKITKSNYNKLSAVILLYREAARVLSPEDATEWMLRPASDGSVPLQTIANSRYIGPRHIPWDARYLLREIT